MAYLTGAELLDALGMTGSSGADGAAVDLAVEAASAMIDEHTNRTFEAEAVATRRYSTVGGRVSVDDIATPAGLAVAVDDDGDGTFERALAVTDYRTFPLNTLPITSLEAVGSGRFPKGEGRVQVSASFGWPAVPALVRQACLVQALRLYQRRHSPFGVAGSPEVGSELRLLSRLDPDVEALVRPLVRGWYVA